MSDKIPTPQVVDVSPDDLRRGKCQLNPQAEAARRRGTSWPLIVVSFAVGYGGGAIARWLLHIPRTPNVAMDFFRPLAALLVMLGVFYGVSRVLIRRSPPMFVAEPVQWLLIGFCVKAFG